MLWLHWKSRYSIDLCDDDENNMDFVLAFIASSYEVDGRYVFQFRHSHAIQFPQITVEFRLNHFELVCDFNLSILIFWLMFYKECKFWCLDRTSTLSTICVWIFPQQLQRKCEKAEDWSSSQIKWFQKAITLLGFEYIVINSKKGMNCLFDSSSLKLSLQLISW